MAVRIIEGTLADSFFIKDENFYLTVDDQGRLCLKDDRYDQTYPIMVGDIPSVIQPIEFPLKDPSSSRWWGSNGLVYFTTFIYNNNYNLFNYIQCIVETTEDNVDFQIKMECNGDTIIDYTTTIDIAGKHLLTITDSDTNFYLNNIPDGSDQMIDLYIYFSDTVSPKYFKLS